MAWEAKAEFLRKTNPFGGGEEPKPEPKALARDVRFSLRSAARTRK